jgi:hypothetical protein
MAVSKPLARLSSRLRRPKLILAAFGASAIVALGIAPTAGATSLAMWPNFECWHHSNNTATLIIDKPSINEDGYTTGWATQIQLWTNDGWMNYYKPAAQRFQDTVFGELVETQISVNVAPNRYYRVLEMFASNDGRPASAYWASPIAGYYTSTICKS